MSTILTLNAGFSSIKFGVYAIAEGLPKKIAGQVESLGPAAELEIGDKEIPIGAADHETAVEVILNAIQPWLDGERVQAVGHRIVHGGTYFSAPTKIDESALQTLESLFPLAPMHEPNNIAAIRAAQVNFPDALQVGCSVHLSSHTSMPRSPNGQPRPGRHKVRDTHAARPTR